MINVQVVLDDLIDFLTLNTDKEIGHSDVPTSSPTLPYAVVFPLPSPTPTGPYLDPQADVELVIQITSVGKSPKQAAYMSHLVREVLIGRSPGGHFNYTMETQGYSVADRIQSTVGSIVKSGDRLFEVPDTYRIKVVP